MGLKMKLRGLKWTWQTKRPVRKQRQIEAIAHQLYQRRLQTGQRGNETSD
ncbi:hypothetical protein IQ256_28470 [cf. Phormidesmis sp. LEGE 11477]|nr:hypothetical protein [cf. Phormidesmis sp. LEGE 11477]